ncbi:MAG: polyprenol monophosphomannose synthase [Acidimicrobiia bacterium]
MRTLVVVPTYLEVENIEEALTRLRTHAPTVDVLVVDDSSPDGTADVAKRVATELGQIDVLVRPKKTGLGEAYRAGFAVGIERGYEILVQMDADLSHDATALPGLLAAVEDSGADLSIGSRYVPEGSVPHWPWHRRALSRWGNWYAGFMLACGVHDMTAGYRAYRRTILEAVRYHETRAVGYGFQIELAYRVSSRGGKIVELPITFADRVRGHSKMSPKVAFEELWLVTWWSLRDRPWWRPKKQRAKRYGTHEPKNASSE